MDKDLRFIFPPPKNLGDALSVQSVCVYCGSSNKVPDHFKELAKKVGVALAKRGHRLVYGGGHVGLMGILADAVMDSGGEVIGIIPEHIRAQEIQHSGLTELHVVPDMHTRKRMMAERSNAFVVLPGGLGTLDETFEIITWKKLHLHNKPIVIFNHEGYWDSFLTLIDKTIKEHFSLPSDRALFTVVTSIEAMFEAIDNESHAEIATLSGRM